MPLHLRSALDFALVLVLLVAVALWVLTPYPRDEATGTRAVLAGAVAAVILAFGFWRRWRWSRQGMVAVWLTCLASAVVFFASLALPAEGLAGQVPKHLAMLGLAAACLYGAASGLVEVLWRLFRRR